jgi:hypothetical protein
MSDIFKCPRAEYLSCSDIEAGIMPRASHFMTLDLSLGQRPFLMCARIFKWCQFDRNSVPGLTVWNDRSAKLAKSLCKLALSSVLFIISIFVAPLSFLPP